MKRILPLLCALYSQAIFADTKITCPDTYPANLLATKGVPGKWKGIAHIPGPDLALQAAGVLAGPPQKQPQGIQRGIEKKTKKGLEVEFPALDAFTEPWRNGCIAPTVPAERSSCCRSFPMIRRRAKRNLK